MTITKQSIEENFQKSLREFVAAQDAYYEGIIASERGEQIEFHWINLRFDKATLDILAHPHFDLGGNYRDSVIREWVNSQLR